MTTATATLTWDEPAQASSPRGWLLRDATCVGFYLDYGPDHYRSPHAGPPQWNPYHGRDFRPVYCRPNDPCRECQPGNVLAVRYPGGPDSELRESRYVETIEQARTFVEIGER